MILVNFKNFKEGTGGRAVELAKVCEKVDRELGLDVIPVVTAFDLEAVRKVVAIPVWVQQVDGVEYGAYTGWLLPELAKEKGAAGTLLNHSEHKLLNDELRKGVERCKAVGLKMCICADSMGEAETVAQLTPDYVAYEPPELIGSSDESASSEKADVVEEVIKRIGPSTALRTIILIGAGIHKAEDVRVGLKLGAKGILVASDVVLAADQEKELRELALAFKGQ